MERIINKTMDRDDLAMSECVKVVDELNELMKIMKARGLSYSSWYGMLDLPYYYWFEKMNRGKYAPWENNADDKNIPWFLLWEIAWVVANTNLKPGSTLLDMGGASSLFSYYLAWKGHKVFAIDLNQALTEHGNKVAEKMGWDMKCIAMDMRELTFEKEYFDHIFSICVYEHIPLSARIEINKKIAGVLKTNGTFALTFDYLNPAKMADISSPESIQRQFVKPSGLTVYGNEKFHDNRKRYLESPYFLPSEAWPISLAARLVNAYKGLVSFRKIFNLKNNEYTFGALFLKKELAQ